MVGKLSTLVIGFHIQIDAGCTLFDVSVKALAAGALLKVFDLCVRPVTPFRPWLGDRISGQTQPFGLTRPGKSNASIMKTHPSPLPKK